MVIDSSLRDLARVRGYHLQRLPDPRPYGVSRTPRGTVIATFHSREGLESWLHDQPVTVFPRY